MSNLREIIKDDSKYVLAGIKGVSRGLFHALYTPFAINTSGRHFSKNINEITPSSSRKINTIDEVRGFFDLVSQISGAVFIHIPLAGYVVSKDMEKEYLGAMVVSNFIDYLINAHRRANKIEA